MVQPAARAACNMGLAVAFTRGVGQPCGTPYMSSLPRASLTVLIRAANGRRVQRAEENIPVVQPAAGGASSRMLRVTQRGMGSPMMPARLCVCFLATHVLQCCCCADRIRWRRHLTPVAQSQTPTGAGSARDCCRPSTPWTHTQHPYW